MADSVTIDDTIERGLPLPAELPDRQREALPLRVARFNYVEIGQITGRGTYTAVIGSSGVTLAGVMTMSWATCS